MYVCQQTEEGLTWTHDYMLKPIKQLIELICAVLYIPLLSFLKKSPLRVVLYYHSINKADVIGFTKQMAYLAEKCIVVKPSKIKSAHTDGAKILAAITFDDAFVSILENAVPILKEHRLPAGIFVPTGNLGQPPRWKIPENCCTQNEAVMSHRQIVELDNDGFEIFSHTLSHPVLSEIEDDKLDTELVKSKQELERILNHEVIGISYPHGAYDDNVCKAALRAGYSMGFTIEPYTNDEFTDNMKIGRFSVSPRDNMTKFKLKVSGAYQAVRFLRVLKTLVVRFIGR